MLEQYPKWLKYLAFSFILFLLYEILTWLEMYDLISIIILPFFLIGLWIIHSKTDRSKISKKIISDEDLNKSVKSWEERHKRLIMFFSILLFLAFLISFLSTLGTFIHPNNIWPGYDTFIYFCFSIICGYYSLKLFIKYKEINKNNFSKQ